MICRLGWALAAAFILDQPIARLMTGVGPATKSVFTFITWFGQGGVILYPASLILLAALALRVAMPRRAQRLNPLIAAAAAIFAVVAAAGLADDALKVIFGRARPSLWLAGDTSGFDFFRYGAKFASFPSGHTATSVAAAIVFSALFPRWKPVFVTFAVMIAASRIILNTHYLSDVVAGVAVGGIVALAVLAQMRKRGLLVAFVPQDFVRTDVPVNGRE